MNSLVHTEVLKDKSLWLAVLVPALVMICKLLGVDMDAATIGTLVGPAITFILASKAKQAHIVGRSMDFDAARKLLEGNGKDE